MERKSSQLDPMIGRIFFNKYTLIKKLGEGSFGAIYSARNGNDYYAIKLENKNKGHNLLENEAYIMSYLHGKGIPFIKSFGLSGEYNVLVMELMGKSLENIFENLKAKTMSVNCVAKLGLQMIEILEYIHNKHIIHRDIKPDNFVMGRNEKSKDLYLLDFGLAKKYRSSTTLKHYPMIKKKNLTGTARYASINALNGLTQSRRDDLEAVGYVLLYFLRGSLPWQGLHVKNKEDRYHKIMEIKQNTTPYELCLGFPSEFEEYVEYTRNLEYKDDPDYNHLKNLFRNILKDDTELIYDWDNESKIICTETTSNTSQKDLKFIKDENNNKDNDKEIKNDVIENVEKEEIKEEKNNQQMKNDSEKDKKTNENNKCSKSDNNNNKENIEEIEEKNVIKDENNVEKEKEKDNNNINEENIYGNFAEHTEEGKEEDKCPNVSGSIHNKGQLEKSNHIRKRKDDSCCLII